jgi:hypothetical protein
MSTLEETSKKRPRDDAIPGSFARSSMCSKHDSASCFHHLVRSSAEFESATDKADACAMGQIANSLPRAVQRFGGAGTKAPAIQEAKTVTWQAIINPDLPEGLEGATARVLGTKAASVAFGRNVRAKKTNDVMDKELNEGKYRNRRTRGDKYSREVVYNYFHQDGDGPDFCPLIEPNKNVQTKWKGKKWSLPQVGLRKLTCTMKIRKGTLGELAADYLDSETHRK